MHFYTQFSCKHLGGIKIERVSAFLYYEVAAFCNRTRLFLKNNYISISANNILGGAANNQPLHAV